MQTETPKQQKPRILPILLIAVLFVLLFIPALSDLRGLVLGLMAGLTFSLYPPLIACGVTVIGIAAGAFGARVDWTVFAADLLTAVPVCVLLGCFFKKPPQPAGFLLSALLTETACLGATLLWASHRAGGSVLDRLFDEWKTAMQAALTDPAFTEVLPETVDPALFQEAMNSAIELYRLRVPFFILMGAAVTALLFFLALLGLRRACGEQRSPLPPFRYFRLSKPAAVLILVSFAGSLLTSGTLAVAMENLYTFLTLAMVVAGLAYAAYWLKQKGLSAGLRGLVLAAGAVVSLVFPLLWYLLLMLGLTDSLWNLRALRFPGRKE